MPRKKTGFGKDGCQKVYEDRQPVVNQKGSSKRPKCGCGSWLNHWKMYSNNADTERIECFYMGCTSDAEDGAHVLCVKKKKGVYSPFGKSYITPLCKVHNNPKFTNPFFIHKGRYVIDDSARDYCKTVKYRLNKQNYFHMKVGKSSGEPKCGCTSYLQHYWNVTGSSRTRCVAMECSNPAKHAAIMRSLDLRTDWDKWIAPVCSQHVKKGSEIFIKRQASLVAQIKTKACQPS